MIWVVSSNDIDNDIKLYCDSHVVVVVVASLKAVNKAKAAAKRKAAASNNNSNATTSSKAGDAGAAVSYKAISDSGAMSPNFESSAITRAETCMNIVCVCLSLCVCVL